MTLHDCMILSWVLFAIALIGLLVRRNLFVLLLTVLLMFNAASLAWVAAAHYHWDPKEQTVFMILLAVVSAQFLIGLGIVVSSIRFQGTADLGDID